MNKFEMVFHIGRMNIYSDFQIAMALVAKRAKEVQNFWLLVNRNH
jgi:hypothetical protein